MKTVKTEWMEMYDVWFASGSSSLRYELEAIDEHMEALNQLQGYDTEVERLLAKYDYIYQLIGDYSRIRFYISGDESGELIIKTFETKNHRNRWVEGMGNAIEIFSEEII